MQALVSSKELGKELQVSMHLCTRVRSYFRAFVCVCMCVTCVHVGVRIYSICMPRAHLLCGNRTTVDWPSIQASQAKVEELKQELDRRTADTTGDVGVIRNRFNKVCVCACVFVNACVYVIVDVPIVRMSFSAFGSINSFPNGVLGVWSIVRVSICLCV